MVYQYGNLKSQLLIFVQSKPPFDSFNTTARVFPNSGYFIVTSMIRFSGIQLQGFRGLLVRPRKPAPLLAVLSRDSVLTAREASLTAFNSLMYCSSSTSELITLRLSFVFSENLVFKFDFNVQRDGREFDMLFP